MIRSEQSRDLSVVVPVYNGAACLEKLHLALSTVLTDAGIDYELIFVNDGSSDHSWDLLNRLKNEDPDRTTIVNLAKNFGQHKTLLCGFGFARGAHICTIDDDLQVHPKEILKLIEKSQAEQSDLIYGVYEDKKHQALRRAGSRAIGMIFRHFASTPGRGSSFKLIRADIAKKILDVHANYIYIDELLCWHASLVTFVPVEHKARENGNSGYSTFALFRLATRIILNYTTLPLRLITWAGLLSSIIFFGVGLFFIWKKYYLGAELGFTALIVAIFFSTGLIMFVLGIIGEYLNRLFAMQTRKPNFQVKEVR